MLVDSTRLKCKREWKQIITYPLQKFFHGCIVISHLLTLKLKTCSVTTFSNFSAIHPTGLSSNNKGGFIMATNGSIRSCSGGHWAKTSGAVDVVMRSLGFWAPRSRWSQQCRKYPAWQWYALRTMWWVPSYAQIHWSTVGRPTSQRDFVDSNKTSRVIRYSWPLKPHDVAGYDHRAACPFLMLIVIILLIITLTSVQAILVEF